MHNHKGEAFMCIQIIHLNKAIQDKKFPKAFHIRKTNNQSEQYEIEINLPAADITSTTQIIIESPRFNYNGKMISVRHFTFDNQMTYLVKSKITGKPIHITIGEPKYRSKYEKMNFDIEADSYCHFYDDVKQGSIDISFQQNNQMKHNSLEENSYNLFHGFQNAKIKVKGSQFKGMVKESRNIDFFSSADKTVLSVPDGKYIYLQIQKNAYGTPIKEFIASPMTAANPNGLFRQMHIHAKKITGRFHLHYTKADFQTLDLDAQIHLKNSHLGLKSFGSQYRSRYTGKITYEMYSKLMANGDNFLIEIIPGESGSTIQSLKTTIVAKEIRSPKIITNDELDIRATAISNPDDKKTEIRADTVKIAECGFIKSDIYTKNAELFAQSHYGDIVINGKPQTGDPIDDSYLNIRGNITGNITSSYSNIHCITKNIVGNVNIAACNYTSLKANSIDGNVKLNTIGQVDFYGFPTAISGDLHYNVYEFLNANDIKVAGKSSVIAPKAINDPFVTDK